MAKTKNPALVRASYRVGSLKTELPKNNPARRVAQGLRPIGFYLRAALVLIASRHRYQDIERRAA